jgi:DNA helicase-2/ATP-dependent DNA helicase PcrA
MNFNQAYKQLNKDQREAVDAIEGPVMVVAGPGTGKTQILTLRIANLLRKTQIEPENILALTFSESGASSMRRRLAEIIGAPAYSVAINTFHGFCNDIIKSYPGDFPQIIGSKNITEVDQINYLEKAIEALPLKELRPFGDPKFYIRGILNCINQLKREGITPEQFKKIVDQELKHFSEIDDLYHQKGTYKGMMKGEYQKQQKQILKNQELIKIYEWYQSNLISEHRYDYSDMIMEVLREISTNKNLLLQIQERYQYILVDEHQDTNNAQNRIVERLADFHKNPNIFVVGDEKQAIFRFQGASLENFNYFKKLYPKTKLIVLYNNYRSSQLILNAANGLLTSQKPLQSDNKFKGGVTFYPFSEPDSEYYFLAKDIQEKINNGIDPSEIAVLYRENKDVLQVTSIFEKFNIPFCVESDQDIMTDQDIKKLLMLLNTTHKFGSEKDLLQSLYIDFLGFESWDIFKIIDTARERKISSYQIIKSKAELKKAGLEKAELFFEFYKKLSGWATLSHNISLPELFELIVRESGFMDYVMKSSQMIEKLEKLNCLFDELKALVEVHPDYGLNEFLQYLETLQTHNVLLKKNNQATPNQIRLMTAHRAKGQEFEHVYIINTFAGHWGTRRRINSLSLPERVFSLSGQLLEKHTTDDDERRLFYVALTRAKKSVSISYSSKGLDGREQLPSQFITEIRPELIETKDTKNIETEFAQNRKVLFAPRLKIGIDPKSKEFISDLFKRNGLSVTSLNNYLDCPWKYFYTNLLRIPQAKTKHQMYGTAIHYTLKDFFDQKKWNEKVLSEKFKTYLTREPLNEKEQKELLEKGTKALAGYFSNYQNLWRKEVINELNVPAIMLTPDIRLTGKIDKLELLNKKGLVNVVDYKTSKPKTRGDIEGSTKNSNGDIKRQLIFYKLLLDNYKNGHQYLMETADIDFIEPDEKGRYKKESFSISKNDVKDLSELVKQTADEIINVKFWDKHCDNKDCEFCALRDVMS